MKNTNIFFPGLGYKDINQALVYVYDVKGNLILRKKTYNGRLAVCLKKYQIYKIEALSKVEKVVGSFYLNENTNYTIAFPISYICNNTVGNTITFLLTDSNYNNLPIQKGLINLWQKQ